MTEQNPYEMMYGNYLVHIPDMPTQQGPLGIFYDFNDGARMLLPEGNWHIRIEDNETGNVIDELDSSGGLVQSSIRYYVRFRIRVWKKDESNPVFEHILNLAGRETQILFPLQAFGDCISWLPIAISFTERHKCLSEFIISDFIADLFRSNYPDIHFTDPRMEKPRFSRPYASYHLGLHFFKISDYSKMYSPNDYRMFPLHCQAASILGINTPLVSPKIKTGSDRPIPERYVAIACRSTKKAKNWLNPNGWKHTVAYLLRIGYRIICIDKNAVQDGEGLPFGVEDWTGDLPLTERAAVIEHCDFFIGMDSGLGWVAWAMGKPVIIIGGYTLPFHIFWTPYRVLVPYACNGCFHDLSVSIVEILRDYYSCPRHKGTSREYECSRLITTKQVIIQINRLMTDHGLSKPCDSHGN